MWSSLDTKGHECGGLFLIGRRGNLDEIIAAWERGQRNRKLSHVAGRAPHLEIADWRTLPAEQAGGDDCGVTRRVCFYSHEQLVVVQEVSTRCRQRVRVGDDSFHLQRVLGAKQRRRAQRDLRPGEVRDVELFHRTVEHVPVFVFDRHVEFNLARVRLKRGAWD